MEAIRTRQHGPRLPPYHLTYLIELGRPLCTGLLAAASMCSYFQHKVLRMAVSDTIMSYLCRALNQGPLLMFPGSPLPLLGSRAMRATLGCFGDGERSVCSALFPAERSVVPD